MDADHIFLILALPVELRLEVYKSLVENCLAGGPLTDISGLYMTCRQIHQEKEVDFIAKNRTLLQAKYNWKKLDPGALAIDLKVVETKDGIHKRRELQIRIPCTQFNLQRQEELDVLDKLMARLAPVLAMPWSKVSLGSLAPPGPQLGQYSIDEHYEFREFFFHGSVIMYDPDLPLLPRFKYPDPHRPPRDPVHGT